jgi:hypothetical protein
MGDKKLRIAVLIRNYSASGGGAERYCVELTNRLSNIHEVHVFSQHNSESSESITFHQIPQWLKKPRYINQLLFSNLTKRATKGRFDIVHSHDMATHANIYTLHVPCVRTKWAQAKGIRKILRWMNTLLSPRKMAYLWLENKEMQVLPNRHFISVSEYLSRNVLESYPRLNGHITIAHPGIEIQTTDDKTIAELRKNFREKNNIPTSAFVLLFVAHGFKIILSDPNVKSILINIFGGIVRCDRVAQGVIDALTQVEVAIPVVIRLEGTNAIEARDLLKEAEHNFIVANSLADAAEKAVKATGEEN